MAGPADVIATWQRSVTGSLEPHFALSYDSVTIFVMSVTLSESLTLEIRIFQI